MTPSTPTADHLTHFDATGQAHMVDVGAKQDTHRIAVAAGTIRMQPATLALITSGSAKKGDVIGIARIAAIMASKRTSDLVPLDISMALLAAEVHRQHRLATADAIVYATARARGADLLTCDAHFAGLPGVVYVKKTGPAGRPG